jgi:hypothetical protein
MLEFLDWAPYRGGAKKVQQNRPRSVRMSVEHVTVDGKSTKVKLFLWSSPGRFPPRNSRVPAEAHEVSLAPRPLTRTQSD